MSTIALNEPRNSIEDAFFKKFQGASSSTCSDGVKQLMNDIVRMIQDSLLRVNPSFRYVYSKLYSHQVSSNTYYDSLKQFTTVINEVLELAQRYTGAPSTVEQNKAFETMVETVSTLLFAIKGIERLKLT